MKRRQIKKRWGFTLVELLTTLAVIGILLGLLVPALNQVSKTATKVKQKAQFHAIGTALEAFRNDYGDYPPSEWDTDTVIADGDLSYGFYSSSQRLAEAIIGRDGFGFHTSSKFIQNGTDGTITAPGSPLYYPDFDPAGDDAARDANLAARKGPYLELESANAVKLSAIYPNPTSFPDTFILADMYKQAKHLVTGKQTGLPILYYRANRLRIGNDSTDYQVINGAGRWPNNTYDLGDSLCANLGFINIPAPAGGRHFGANVVANADTFYDAIANPNFTSPVRPYRTESFILHSAGPDGLYGTVDDVFNFDAEK